MPTRATTRRGIRHASGLRGASAPCIRFSGAAGALAMRCSQASAAWQATPDSLDHRARSGSEAPFSECTRIVLGRVPRAAASSSAMRSASGSASPGSNVAATPSSSITRPREAPHTTCHSPATCAASSDSHQAVRGAIPAWASTATMARIHSRSTTATTVSPFARVVPATAWICAGSASSRSSTAKGRSARMGGVFTAGQPQAREEHALRGQHGLHGARLRDLLDGCLALAHHDSARVEELPRA
jgi:hypothetical protein